MLRASHAFSGRLCILFTTGAVVSLFSGAVSGAVLTFEMTVAPDAESTPMTKVGDGFGDLAAGDFGAPLNAGLQGDGTARLVDSGNNGQDGYSVNNIGGGAGTFTIDMKVRANNTVQPGAGNDIRSMGVSDGTNQRGIRIEPAGMTLVNGTGPVAGGAASVDLSTFHMVRIVVK